MFCNQEIQTKEEDQNTANDYLRTCLLMSIYLKPPINTPGAFAILGGLPQSLERRVTQPPPSSGSASLSPTPPPTPPRHPGDRGPVQPL